MVWAGIRMGARTNLISIRENVDALKYRNEVVIKPVIITGFCFLFCDYHAEY